MLKEMPQSDEVIRKIFPKLATIYVELCNENTILFDKIWVHCSRHEKNDKIVKVIFSKM